MRSDVESWIFLLLMNFSNNVNTPKIWTDYRLVKSLTKNHSLKKKNS